jgi:hemin uptake protein HemP
MDRNHQPMPTDGPIAVRHVLSSMARPVAVVRIMADPDDQPAERDDADAPPPAIRLDAEQLFAGQRELWIEYRGERYRLRITRRGRLILTK